MQQKITPLSWLALLGFVLINLSSCSPSQKNAVTTTPAPATATQASGQFTGIWKITAFTIAEAPAEITPEIRKLFETKMVEIGSLEINANGTYTMQAVEAPNIGIWKADGNTLTFTKTDGEVDVLKINSNTNNTITGQISTGENVKVNVELKRTSK